MCEFLGISTLSLATQTIITAIFISFDVVPEKLSAFLFLGVLDEYSMYPNTVTDELVKFSIFKQYEGLRLSTLGIKWKINLRCIHGHVYATLSSIKSFNLSDVQLRKIHRQFTDHSANKLYKLLHKTLPEDTTPDTLENLK